MTINRLISKYNFNIIKNRAINYIVIHYVGAVSTAQNNAKYFAGGNRNSSAHYFVGWEGEIWQSVEDVNAAWHCGASTYKHPKCRNNNSIGIELCCKKDNSGNWYFEDATVKAAAELARMLMQKYNIPVSNVIRHYDVTGKVCPAPYVNNNTKHTWSEFLSLISMVKETPVTQQTTQSNDEVVWNFLKGKGYSDVAVAGIMGNLQAESSLKPTNLQNTFEKKIGLTDEEYTIAVDNDAYTNFVHDGAGYGLAQWTYYSRKENLLKHIKNSHMSIGDLKGQLEFLCKELETSYSSLVKQLKKANTVEEASTLVLTNFEKPKDQSDAVKATRAKYSQTFYDKFNSKQASKVPYKVKVMINDLNIRKGPGTKYDSIGYTGIGVFTIVEVDGNWGKLKSGKGWICLDYAKEV